eukprot:5061357-Prymnesium_polylepis.2
MKHPYHTLAEERVVRRLLRANRSGTRVRSHPAANALLCHRGGGPASSSSARLHDLRNHAGPTRQQQRPYDEHRDGEQQPG